MEGSGIHDLLYTEVSGLIELVHLLGHAVARRHGPGDHLLGDVPGHHATGLHVLRCELHAVWPGRDESYVCVRGELTRFSEGSVSRRTYLRSMAR